MLLAALALRAMPLAAWAGVVTLAVIAPLGAGIAVLAPATMAVACLAFAVGPDRLLDWVRHEWVGREEDDATLAAGWIEDDRLTVDCRAVGWPTDVAPAGSDA